MCIIVYVWNYISEFRQCSVRRIYGELSERPDALVGHLGTGGNVREHSKRIMPNQIESGVATDIALGNTPKIFDFGEMKISHRSGLRSNHQRLDPLPLSIHFSECVALLRTVYHLRAVETVPHSQKSNAASSCTHHFAQTLSTSPARRSHTNSATLIPSASLSCL